jgi:5'-3' exoribonuclease 2
VPAEAAKPAFKPGKKLTVQQQAESLKAGLAAMSGSNADIVKNRKAIRMANMSAADKLRAELEGEEAPKEDAEGADESMEEKPENGEEGTDLDNEDDEEEDDDDEAEDAPSGSKRKKTGRTGRQRKARKLNDDGEEEEEDDDEAPPNPGDEHVAKKKLKINPDGTVDYEDTVRLWEPGYRERYYRQKFGVELSDTAFISE